MYQETFEFRITIVGLDILRTVKSVLDKLDVNLVNPVNRGRFGNFKTLTFSMDISGVDVFNERKRIMAALAKESTHLFPMYPHGNALDVYIFDKRAFLK